VVLFFHGSRKQLRKSFLARHTGMHEMNTEGIFLDRERKKAYVSAQLKKGGRKKGGGRRRTDFSSERGFYTPRPAEGERGASPLRGGGEKK